MHVPGDEFHQFLQQLFPPLWLYVVPAQEGEEC